MNQYIFMWLHSYIEIDYLDYLELMKYFKNVKEIYNMSFSYSDFKNFINSNNIKIDNKKIYKFCNQNLKNISKKMFDCLKLKNIVILTINSNNFPIKIDKNVNYKNIPLVFYAKGNLNNLNKIKVNIYYDTNFSNYGFKLYNDFCSYLKLNNIAVVSDYFNKNISICLVHCIFNYYDLDDSMLILSNNLNINNKLSINENDSEYLMKNNSLIYLSDILLIPESSYNLKCVNIVDKMLDLGCDIYVVPGNIYDKNSYFSNYLISLGAYVVTGKYNFLKNILEGEKHD